jgi:hypothetical protein
MLFNSRLIGKSIYNRNRKISRVLVKLGIGALAPPKRDGAKATILMTFVRNLVLKG